MAFQGSLETWKTWRFEYYLSRSEIAWNLSQKVRKPEQNKKFSRKPGTLRYTTFQYYIETIFSKFCTRVILEHLWHLPFGAKIVCNITWRIAFGPGQNLDITWNVLAKTTGNLAFTI